MANIYNMGDKPGSPHGAVYSWSEFANDINNFGGSIDDFLAQASKDPGLSPEKSQFLAQLGLQRMQTADDRAYNDPSAQVARLVAAGMSRTQALQMVSGGSAATPPEVPTPQMTPEAQSALQGVESVASIAQVIMGAAQFGMTVPQIRANNYIAQNAATMSRASIDGFNTAGMIFSCLDNAIQAGVLSRETYDSIGSAPEAAQFIRDHADEVPEFASLVDSGALDHIADNSLSLSALNTAWREYRSSADYARSYDAEIKRVAGVNALQRIQFDKAAAELPLIAAQVDLTYADLAEKYASVLLIDAQTTTESKRAGFVDAQTGLVRQQTATEVANTSQMEASARIRNNEADISDASTPTLKQITLDELEVKLAQWSALNTPESRQKSADAWCLENADNALLLATISKYYSTCELNTARRNEQMVGIGKVLDRLGLHGWINDNLIGVAGTLAQAFF